ncbi:MAG: sulfur carrier protein ThiS [Candidatus Eisenbacteria bacterium]
MGEIVVNGEKRPLPGPIPLPDLLEEMGIRSRWAIVERNGEPVPRERYEETTILPGHRIEIATPTAGG